MKNIKLYIDGHIHFYDCFSPESFFEAAENNFSKYQENEKNPINILLFTEGKKDNFFEFFKNNRDIYAEKGYRIKLTEEANSLIVKKEEQELLYIIQGRQIVTKENIEILSVGTTHIIEDGKSAGEVIDELIREKKPAILAWGFGKWLFSRGEFIHNLILNNQSPYLFIGDNSGRPSFWRKPELYKTAEKKGYKIINGSDPLPFKNEANKPGSFGFKIEGEFDKKKPADSLIKILTKKEIKIEFFGKRDGRMNFFKRQLKMFLKKHLNLK